MPSRPTMRLTVEKDHSRGTGYVIWADATTMGELQFAVDYALERVIEPAHTSMLAEISRLFHLSWSRMTANGQIHQAARENYRDI